MVVCLPLPIVVSTVVSGCFWLPDHESVTILFVGAVYPEESLDIVDTEPTDMAMRPVSMLSPFCTLNHSLIAS